LGITALFIIGKFEETNSVKLHRHLEVTEYSYSTNQVLKMESTILETVQYQLYVATPYSFLNYYFRVLDLPETMKQVSIYLSHTFLLNVENFSKFYPSQIGLAAINACLERNCVGLNVFKTDELLNKTTGKGLSQTLCDEEMRRVYKKYNFQLN